MATQPPIVATWKPDDELDVSVFTPDDYADWAGANGLHGTYPFPTHFYGVGTDAALVKLAHTVETTPYDDYDFAIVAHTWLSPDGTTYAIGYARHDGRA
jgi:hypothetical protein